ncbi:DUF6482 family protein [Ferrimonas marina]|uniref:Uncharacterized protein n=1 Tax=Ferrimonas marina TaxID=299255 RepID=A0A1M5YSL5_9GAMM|nr:DUF6482 family protein [Ferrimonas marina]SHI15096.1 hypothetical protein SAMN02745129_4392 [Ferrimonas marina]
MAITLQQLKHSPDIDRVMIHSLECALYSASVEINGQTHAIYSQDDEVLTTRSLVLMRQALADVPAGKVHLNEHNAYDEMVGL